MIRFIAGLSWMLVAFSGIQGTSQAQNAKEFHAVVGDVARLLLESNKTGRPQRLAVITFISTRDKNEKAKNEFGDYITESLITALSKNPKAFKLFERSRLDIVLRENDLMLSDLMDQNQAKKAGELLPIDVIFSGTYTKLKNYIDVNSRLIDVVTGEIAVSFSGRILMTDDLASLFGEEEKKDDTKKVNRDETTRCQDQIETIRTLLNDLTSRDKIDGIAKQTMKIPFDLECGRAHFDVMARFGRYKIEHDPYRRFLMKTLDTIRYPVNDDRATEIIRFLASDSVIDEEEWRIGLQTVKKMNHYRLRYCLSAMLRILPLPDELSLNFRRIDEYFDEARAGKVGLPVALSFTDAFFYMTEAVNSESDNRLAKYCYDRYGSSVELDKTTNKKLSELLASVYENEKDRNEKTRTLKWLADYYNRSESNDVTAELMYAFVNFFDWNPGSNFLRIKKSKDRFPLEDLESFSGLCRDKLSEYAVLTKAGNVRDDRIEFCVMYNVPVPGIIPTMEEARDILAGMDIKEQLRILPLLEKMRSRPAVLEKELVALLGRKSLERQKEMKKIHTSALIVLSHAGTKNEKAIECMVESLTDDVYMTSDKAVDAIAGVGESAVPFLVRKLNSKMEYARIKQRAILTAISRLGKKASSARNDLQRMLNNTADTDLKYAIEAALQSMEK